MRETMIPALVALLVPILMGDPAHADVQGHALECPARAPDDWKLPNAPLSGVEVLSSREGEAIDETAPPSLVPDEQSIQSGTLHQSWKMNADGPEWIFFVDCHYKGTDRILRLDARTVTRCDRTISHFSRTTGETARSEQRMRCG